MNLIRHSIVILIAITTSIAHAKDTVLLVAGMGGEEKYTTQFAQTLEHVRTALVQKHHYAAENIHLLTEHTDSAMAGPSTLDSIRSEIQTLSATSTAKDSLLLILVGHGQSDYVEPKFNLPGPDLDGATLNQLLTPLPMQDIRLILSFPCAGQFSEFLRDPRYSVIASTDGPRQIYLCAMNEFLAKAFEDDFSDSDGDGALMFRELYEFLSQEVDGYYEAQDFLQTENVSLEDNGDGRVTTRADGMNAGDGELSGKRRICPAPAFKESKPSEEPAR